MRYTVKRTPSGWWIYDTTSDKQVERHRTSEDAERSCKRLNGICLHCGRPLAECEKDFPRDPNFGADYEEEED